MATVRSTAGCQKTNNKMVGLVGLEPTTKGL